MKHCLSTGIFLFALLFISPTQSSAKTIRIRSNSSINKINETISRARDGDKIKFPKNKTFLVDKQIIFDGKNDISVNFNGCCFALVDNAKLTTRTLNGYYVDRTILQITNCKNIKVFNVFVDGNREHNSSDRIIGLSIGGVTGSFEKVVARNCNFHHIVFYNNIDVSLFDIEFENIGQATGKSDVFTHEAYKNVHTVWRNVRSSRPYNGEENLAQIFYFGGGFNEVYGLYSTNCNCGIDQRSGKLIAKDIEMHDCAGFRVISYESQVAGEEPDVYIENMRLFDVYFSDNRNSYVYITSCARCTLKDIAIYPKQSETVPLTNIRIRKFFDKLDVQNVIIENFKVHYTSDGVPIYGILLEGVNDNVSLTNVDIKCIDAAIRSRGECKEAKLNLHGFNADGHKVFVSEEKSSSLQNRIKVTR